MYSFLKVILNLRLLFTIKLTRKSSHEVRHLLIQFIHAVRSYFCSVLMGNLNVIFLYIIRLFQGIGAPGFCKVKQKDSDIRH